ncbi:MAG TPA: acetyl-CoA carboxylase biotin carboxyl carrier protein [Polyangiaceae bacterium]|nr:acetyl-CoA carboxylase biotin carboxyl carrier protein [Polyangiaceae bacterium]
MQISLEQLKSLLETLEKGDVSEFEYEDEQLKLRLSLGKKAAQVVHAAPVLAAAPTAAATAAAAAAAAKISDDNDPSVVFITSPFVGTFYRAPGPDAANFCEVGSSVKQGQALCIIEAMKLMNEIESDAAGTILDILVENGKSVEFGQKLFKLKKG